MLYFCCIWTAFELLCVCVHACPESAVDADKSKALWDISLSSGVLFIHAGRRISGEGHSGHEHGRLLTFNYTEHADPGSAPALEELYSSDTTSDSICGIRDALEDSLKTSLMNDQTRFIQTHSTALTSTWHLFWTLKDITSKLQKVLHLKEIIHPKNG